jgi:hypothetical protein
MDVKGLTGQVVDYLNEAYPDELDRQVTVEDVDFSKAFKFYIDTDIFVLPSNDYGEIRQALEEGWFMFEIPVYIGQDTFTVNVVKGRPVDYENLSDRISEERIKELESQVDQWYLQGSTYFEDTHLDYYNVTNERVDIYDQQPLLVGGLPHFHYPVALYANEDGDIGKLVPISAAPSSYYGFLELDESTDENAPAVFDYVKIKEIIATLPPGSSSGVLISEDSNDNAAVLDSSDSGTSIPTPSQTSTTDQHQTPTDEMVSPSVPLFIAVAAVSVAAVVAVVLLCRRKARRKDGETRE